MQRFVYLLLIALLATPTLAGYGQTMKEKPEVVATGRFTDKEGQHTSGTYRIERVEEDLRLVLSDDFKTDKGPDLHVVLSPTTALDATTTRWPTGRRWWWPNSRRLPEPRRMICPTTQIWRRTTRCCDP